MDFIFWLHIILTCLLKNMALIPIIRLTSNLCTADQTRSTGVRWQPLATTGVKWRTLMTGTVEGINIHNFQILMRSYQGLNLCPRMPPHSRYRFTCIEESIAAKSSWGILKIGGSDTPPNGGYLQMERIPQANKPDGCAIDPFDATKITWF